MTSFDEVDHSDASNAAHHALNNAPARARHIAWNMIIDDEASGEEAPPLSDDSPQMGANSSGVNPTPTLATHKAINEDNNDVETNILDLPVMQVKLQDIDMHERGLYEDLPFIQRRAFIDLYGYDKALGDVPCQTTRVARLKSRMTEENMQSLLQALLFVRHGYYINPGRVDPSLLTSNCHHLVLKGDGTYATCLMAGVIALCHLAYEGILAGTSSFDNEKFLQHCILINPFAQEIVCKTAVIFQSFGLPASGVREGGYAVPKIKACTNSNDDLFDVDVVPLCPAFENSNTTCTVLEYNDIVPIYDGRAEMGRPFRFTPADFNALPSWQPFMNNRSDLPRLSVVSVGYSVNWYTLDRDNPNAQRYLSMNVLFIIVLNTPSSLLTKGSGSCNAEPLANKKGKGCACD
ncbi:hypothetical protein DXG01_016219 [Tephrocybe rancida]|nr:hypothetical protein DXG01_016219 [Tephrocybe rancida]